jgi:hypothetical protein
MTQICGECGVRYEDGLDECPLCARKPPAPPGDAGPEKNSSRHFREVITFTAFSAGLIAFITDLAYSGSLSWSRIPLLSLGYSWLTAFMLSVSRKANYLRVTVAAASIGAYLYFLSRLTSGPDGWFQPIALPIVAAAALLSLLVTAVLRLFSLPFLGKVSAVLVGMALFTVSIDLTLSPGASWSLVTASGIVPVTVFLAGLEKRLRKKGSSLEKYFHT